MSESFEQFQPSIIELRISFLAKLGLRKLAEISGSSHQQLAKQAVERFLQEHSNDQPIVVGENYTNSVRDNVTNLRLPTDLQLSLHERAVSKPVDVIGYATECHIFDRLIFYESEN